MDSFNLCRYLNLFLQLESEEANRAAKRRVEREKGRREAVADMSEDLSEGEKGETISDVSTHGESHRGRLPRMSSIDAMEAWANQQKGKNLYLVLIRFDPLSISLFTLDYIWFDLMLEFLTVCMG